MQESVVGMLLPTSQIRSLFPKHLSSKYLRGWDQSSSADPVLWSSAGWPDHEADLIFASTPTRQLENEEKGNEGNHREVCRRISNHQIW